MLVFITVSLWLVHKEFPKNLLLLIVLFFALIPVAYVYGWLTDPRLIQGTNLSRRRMPPLLVVGIGAAIPVFGYALFSSEIYPAFYPG